MGVRFDYCEVLIMKIAYKPYSSFPQSFEMKNGINPAWPAEMKMVTDGFNEDGWIVLEYDDYKSLLSSMEAEKEIFNEKFKSNE